MKTFNSISVRGINVILKDGTKKRLTLAKNCAQLDAPILKKPVEELLELYSMLFMNISTDELLVKCSAQSTAQQRWDMVEPFTWGGGEES